MKAILVEELQSYPDGTIWTTHDQPNGLLLPMGAFRIKRAAGFAKDASFRPNWYLAHTKLTANMVSGHNYALRQTPIEFDPTVVRGKTILVWDDADIKELQSLLKASMATAGNPEMDVLTDTYNFECLGFQLNTGTGRALYLNRTFKLSPQQVKVVQLISSTAMAGKLSWISAEELANHIGPNSANPALAVQQLVTRTLKAIGHPIGTPMCPILKADAKFRWVGNTFR